MQSLKSLLINYWIEIGGILILMGIYISDFKDLSLTNRIFLFVVLVLISGYYIWSKFKIIKKNKINNGLYSKAEIDRITKEEKEFLETTKDLDASFDEWSKK